MNSCQNKRPLEGQRALVTGANDAIGAAVAEALADAGAKVMINYLGDRDKAEKVAERIRAKQGQAMIFQTDVSEESQVKSMFDVLIGYWGSVDILVNNASLQHDAALIDMSLEQWNKVLSVNLTGQFLCAREAAREFLRRGVVPELSRSAGKIICITTQDVISSVGAVNVAAAKGGVNLLMKSLAQELSNENVRINGIFPGIMKTPNKTSEWESSKQKTGQLSTPVDIARTVVWLASDDSCHVNSVTFYVDSDAWIDDGDT
jgi:glucose 1-dehydrogenase